MLAVLVVGSALTFAYSARFLWGAFVLPRRLLAGTEGVNAPHPDRPRSMFTTSSPPTWAFVAPGAVLAALTVFAGVYPTALDPIVTAAASVARPARAPGAPRPLARLNLALGCRC